LTPSSKLFGFEHVISYVMVSTERFDNGITWTHDLKQKGEENSGNITRNL